MFPFPDFPVIFAPGKVRVAFENVAVCGEKYFPEGVIYPSFFNPGQILGESVGSQYSMSPEKIKLVRMSRGLYESARSGVKSCNLTCA